MLWEYLGGVLIAVIVGPLFGWLISVIAYAGMPGAWMARRKVFKIGTVAFFLFYLLLHTLFFAWG